MRTNAISPKIAFQSRAHSMQSNSSVIGTRVPQSVSFEACISPNLRDVLICTDVCKENQHIPPTSTNTSAFQKTYGQYEEHVPHNPNKKTRVIERKLEEPTKLDDTRESESTKISTSNGDGHWTLKPDTKQRIRLLLNDRELLKSIFQKLRARSRRRSLEYSNNEVDEYPINHIQCERYVNACHCACQSDGDIVEVEDQSLADSYIFPSETAYRTSSVSRGNTHRSHRKKSEIEFVPKPCDFAYRSTESTSDLSIVSPMNPYTFEQPIQQWQYHQNSNGDWKVPNPGIRTPLPIDSQCGLDSDLRQQLDVFWNVFLKTESSSHVNTQTGIKSDMIGVPVQSSPLPTYRYSDSIEDNQHQNKRDPYRDVKPVQPSKKVAELQRLLDESRQESQQLKDRLDTVCDSMLYYYKHCFGNIAGETRRNKTDLVPHAKNLVVQQCTPTILEHSKLPVIDPYDTMASRWKDKANRLLVGSLGSMQQMQIHPELNRNRNLKRKVQRYL